VHCPSRSRAPKRQAHRCSDSVHTFCGSRQVQRSRTQAPPACSQTRWAALSRGWTGGAGAWGASGSTEGRGSAEAGGSAAGGGWTEGAGSTRGGRLGGGGFSGSCEAAGRSAAAGAGFFFGPCSGMGCARAVEVATRSTPASNEPETIARCSVITGTSQAPTVTERRGPTLSENRSARTHNTALFARKGGYSRVQTHATGATHRAARTGARSSRDGAAQQLRPVDGFVGLIVHGGWAAFGRQDRCFRGAAPCPRRPCGCGVQAQRQSQSLPGVVGSRSAQPMYRPLIPGAALPAGGRLAVIARLRGALGGGSRLHG
jgi:hypothetical protein